MGKNYEVAKHLYHDELYAPPTNSKIHFWIEVHWDLAELSWPGGEDRVQGLFDRSVGVETTEVAFEALNHVDALIHRVLNTAWWHYRDLRLIWIYDVVLLARQLTVPDQWKILQERCAVWRCRLALELSLKLARDWMGLRLPPGFDDFSCWPTATAAERELWTAITAKHNRLLPYLVLLLRDSADPAELLRAGFHLLFPDRAWMCLKYPPADGWRLPVAYTRRWRRWIIKGFE